MCIRDSYVPDGDAIFATGWQTVQPVLEYPETKGEKCHLVQGYDSYHAPKELVDGTWRAPLAKVLVSKWLVELGKELGCQDMLWIPNAVDHDRYRLLRPIEGRPPRVAMLYSTVSVKGAADGIEALGVARRRYPHLQAVFFGLNHLRFRIPRGIEYYRNPPQDFIVGEIYNNSSIFLCPSWSEGFALPPAEAAACGCAVVSTDNGGIREFIEDGVTGLLSAPKDTKALADNLCLLLENDDLRVRLAKACNSVVAQFSWERSATLLENFITDVLYRRQPAQAVIDDRCTGT